jgi:signal transduction histidine kinase
MEFIFTYISDLFAVVCFCYAGLIFYKDYKNKLAVYLAQIVLFTGLWAFANALADISQSGKMVLFFSGLALLSYMFFAASFFSFVYFFIKKYISVSFWYLVITYGFSTTISVLAFTPLSYKNPVVFYTSPAVVEVGPVILISVIIAHLIFAAAYFLIFKNYKKMPEKSKYQILYIFIGSLITVLGAIFFTVVLPMLGNPNFYSTGPVFGVFLITAISYSIFKHQLIDTKITISNLEKKILERTLELQTLQQTQSQMMIDISHALQTPLTIIKSHISSLKQSPEFTEKANEIEKVLDQISKKTYDLIRLAKLETKTEELNFEPVNLTELLNDIAEQMEIVCQAQNITFEHKIQPGVFVYGDKKKLEELITNLLSNAIKYIANQRKIYLQLAKKQFIEIEVTDTGIGIPENMTEQIFEKFYRAKTSSLNNIGTGVGLAICKKILDYHNGKIKVVSKPGQGSSFTVYLAK